MATSVRCQSGLASTVHAVGDPDGAYVEEVAVLASHERRCIGSELLRQTTTWMAELGRNHLTILPTSGAGWAVGVEFEPGVGGAFEADARQIAAT